jgi:hypothetical protein
MPAGITGGAAFEKSAASALEDGERTRLGAESDDGDEGENQQVRHLKISVGIAIMPVMFQSHAARHRVCFIGDNSGMTVQDRRRQERLSSRLRLATTLRR